MKPLAVMFLLLCLAAPLPAQEAGNGYSIDADTIDSDASAGVTTYQGNARAEIGQLAIEADSITITHGDGLPSKVEADGDPVSFERRASDDSFSGSAGRIVLQVAERKLTLFDYAIVDQSGNSMKGGKASFVLER